MLTNETSWQISGSFPPGIFGRYVVTYCKTVLQSLKIWQIGKLWTVNALVITVLIITCCLLQGKGGLSLTWLTVTVTRPSPLGRAPLLDISAGTNNRISHLIFFYLASRNQPLVICFKIFRYTWMKLVKWRFANFLRRLLGYRPFEVFGWADYRPVSKMFYKTDPDRCLAYVAS